MSDPRNQIPTFDEVMQKDTHNGKIPSFEDIMGDEIPKKKVSTLPDWLSGGKAGTSGGLLDGIKKGASKVKNSGFREGLPTTQDDVDRRNKEHEDILGSEEFKADPVKKLNNYLLGEANKTVTQSPAVAESTNQKHLQPEHKINEETVNAFNIGRLKDDVQKQMFPTTNDAIQWSYKDGKNGVLDEKNETDKLAKEVIDENRKVKSIISANRGDLKLAAVEYYADKDPQIKAIVKAGGLPPEATQQRLLARFLHNKDVIEEAHAPTQMRFDDGATFNEKYNEQKGNFRIHNPEQWTHQIIQQIAQGREDYGENNPLLNLTGVKSSDRVVGNLVKDGKMDKQDLQHYMEEVRPLIARGGAKIPTSGFLENTVTSAVEGVATLPKSITELTGIRNLYTTKAGRAYENLEEDESAVGLNPKGVLNNIGYHGGKLTGFVIPIAGESKLLQTAGLIKDAKLANEVATGVSFYHDLYKENEKANPEGGIVNNIAALAQTAAFVKLNPFFGKITGGAIKEATPEIKSILKRLESNSIEAAAAKEQVVKTITKKIVDKLASTSNKLGNVAKKTVTGATQMFVAQIASDAVGGVFTGKYSFDESVLKATNAGISMLYGLPLLHLATPGSGTSKESLGSIMYEMTDKPEETQSRISELLKEPEFEKEAPQILENFNHATEVRKQLDEMPNLNQKQKEKYLLVETQKKILEDKVKNSPSKNLTTAAEKKIAALDIEQQMITDPEMGNKKFVEEMYNEELLPKGANMLLEDVDGKFSPNKVGAYLKFIAQQANGLGEDWKPVGDKKPTMEGVPDQIIEIANERWKKEIESAEPKPDLGFDTETNQATSEGQPPSSIPVEGKESEHQIAANKIQELRSEHNKQRKELEADLDTKLQAAKKRGFKEGEFDAIYSEYNKKDKDLLTNQESEIGKYSDAVGGDVFLMKGDKNAKQGHHFTSESVLDEILDSNEIVGYMKSDEGYGGVSLTTDKNLDDKGIVLEYGGSSNKNKTTSDQGIRIDFNIERLKQDGYKTKLGNEDLGTFPNEQEVRIIKDNGDGIAATDETTVTDAKKYIDNVQINKKILGEEKTKEIIKKLEEQNISYTLKGESEKQSNEPIPEATNEKGSAENKQGNLSTEEGKQSEIPPPEGGGEAEGGEKKGGITHAATQETTRKAGLPDYEGHTPVTHEERIAAAKASLKENPNLHNEIMQKVEKGGDLTPQDNAVLAVYKGSLDAELEANPSKELYDKVSRIAKVLNPEGTKAGQLLESRKLIDFNEESISNFLLDKEASQAAPLTDKQVKDETAKFVELKAAKEELEKQLAAEKQKNAELIAQYGVNKAKAMARKASKKTHEEYVKERKDTVAAAREALKKAREGGLKLAVPGIAELKAIVPHVKEFMRSLANEGVDKLDNIVSAIHAEFKDVLEGITKSDIIDILAGIHDEKKATRNDKAKTIHLLKREAQLLRELAKARKGEPKNETVKAQKDARIKELEDKIKEVRKNNSKEEPIDDTLPFEFTDDELANHKEQEKLRNKIKSLEDDIKNKKYAQEPEVKPVLKMDRKTILLKDKVIELEDKIRLERAKDEYKKRNKWLRAWDKVMEVLGIRRIVQTAVDLSIPFRQGITLLGNRKAIWAKSFGKMITSFANPKKYARLMYDIRHSADYHDMTKDGIVFNELNADNPNIRNEDFQKSFIYKIPVVSEPLKASNRGADAFLNIARYEMYMKLKSNLERQGMTRQSDPKAYEFAANWAMNMTGRGKMIDALENPLARTILGNTFYGARLMASRFNLLNPITYFDPRIPKQVRYQAMKDMLSFTGTIMASGLALAAAGGKISLNPWDSDFLQVRFGNKVYDLSGGLANYVRTGLRLVSAAYTRATGSKYESRQATDKAGKSALNFFRNKLSPNTSYATDWFFGKSNGQDFDAKEIYKIYPMYADDVKKGLKEDGAVSLLTVLLPNLLGVGYGNYKSKGETDEDIDTLLDRNMRTDELDKSKIKNFNDKGREITNDEFKQYVKDRNEEIKKGIERLYNKGAVVIDNGNVVLKPYKELTKDEVVAETTAIKANATRKTKKALFGEKEKDEDEDELQKEQRELKKELFPNEYEKEE